MSAQPPFAYSDGELLARFRGSINQPRCSQTLGFEMLEIDQAQRRIVARFIGGEEFTNPSGNIQGGMLSAMLDDAMSVAGLVASGMTCVMPTLEMKTSFLRPALPGPLQAVGRVVKWGKTIAFLEGELFDSADQLIAKASATAMPTPFNPQSSRDRGT